VKPLKRAKTSERLLPSGPLYWTRFGLGVTAGIVCGILRLGIEGMAVGASLYLASFLILLLMYHVPLGAKGQGRTYYTMGLGSYVAVWFTAWILLNTLIT